MVKKLPGFYLRAYHRAPPPLDSMVKLPAPLPYLAPGTPSGHHAGSSDCVVIGLPRRARSEALGSKAQKPWAADPHMEIVDHMSAAAASAKIMERSNLKNCLKDWIGPKGISKQGPRTDP